MRRLRRALIGACFGLAAVGGGALVALALLGALFGVVHLLGEGAVGFVGAVVVGMMIVGAIIGACDE